MVVGYRLCKARYAPRTSERARRAGDGAAKAGGRWNSPGVRAVYASGSIALAVLEILVHSPIELPDEMELWQVEIPPECVRIQDLPESWRRDHYDPAVQAWAAARLAQLPAIELPSAVIPLESNFVLNPDHPQYPADRWTMLGAYDFDFRLRPHGKVFVIHEG